MPTTTATALDIINRAMKFAGIAGQGLDVAAEDASDVLDILNGMLDGWTMDRLYIYNVRFDIYPLTANKQTYTIGQSGTPDINAVRPNKLENANIVITSQTPNVRRPLYLMDDDDWAGISLRSVPTPTLPTALYYSRDFPNATLNFWPTPQSGLSVELEVWQQLAQFADFITSFAFPPGYYEAVYQNLAVRLSTPEYGIDAVPQSIEMQAEQSRARIQSLNMDPPPQLKADAGMQGVRQGNMTNMPLFNAKNPAPQWYR